MTDYVAMIKARANDVKQHGIKGMHWGIRRTDAQLASDTKKRKSSGEDVTPTAKAKAALSTPTHNSDGTETAATRYARLSEQARSGGSRQLSESDLKWFNARTEALSKVDKMFSTNPSWLQATSKKVLQQAAQNTMQSIADGVAKKYISTPILDSIEPKKK